MYIGGGMDVVPVMSQKVAQKVGEGKAKRAATANQKRGLNATGTLIHVYVYICIYMNTLILNTPSSPLTANQKRGLNATGNVIRCNIHLLILDMCSGVCSLLISSF
jgi:hypothetical protein